jgi:hypothetical protein
MIERLVIDQLGGDFTIDYAELSLTCRIAMPVSIT